MKRHFVRTAITVALTILAISVLRPYLNDILPALPKPETAEDYTLQVPEEEKTLYGPYTVAYVVDGDTAFINIDGTEVKVRFIGIDTPESVHQDESRNTPEGKTASEFTKQLLTGKNVYLEYDLQTEDDYGRTLAYVYLEDGVTMVQDEILAAGMATTLTVQPNSKYASHFYELQVKAREAGVGFWATGFFS